MDSAELKTGKIYKSSARKPMAFRPWDEWRRDCSK